jgi:hypothetical protein
VQFLLELFGIMLLPLADDILKWSSLMSLLYMMHGRLFGVRGISHAKHYAGDQMQEEKKARGES